MFHYNPDNRVMQILSLYFDLIVLTVLWMITSVPIVTIGVSTTAMYRVLFKMVTEHDEIHIMRMFLSCWRNELRRSTAIWALLSGLLAIVVGDFFVCVAYRPDGFIAPFLWVGAVLAALVTLCLLAYAFPINARFDCTVKQVFRNAIYFIGRNPVATLGLVSLVALMGAAIFFLMALSVFMLGPLLYAETKQLNKIFQPIILQIEEESLSGRGSE